MGHRLEAGLGVLSSGGSLGRSGLLLVVIPLIDSNRTPQAEGPPWPVWAHPLLPLLTGRLRRGDTRES